MQETRGTPKRIPSEAVASSQPDQPKEYDPEADLFGSFHFAISEIGKMVARSEPLPRDGYFGYTEIFKPKPPELCEPHEAKPNVT